MNIIFAGTPGFAVAALDVIVKAGHRVLKVYSQPDTRSGRGLKIQPSAVKIYAQKNELSTATPRTLKNLAPTDFSCDAMIVAAYGHILPADILRTPTNGCINIHASLLPRWRGAAPIERAILAGDDKTGITMMRMDETLDGGDILLQREIPIDRDDNAKLLRKKLAGLGASMIVETLENLPKFILNARAQNPKNATYAHKLKKHEAWIDWREDAQKIERKIRAFNPYPIAKTRAEASHFNDKILRIFAARALEKSSDKKPGEIIETTKKKCWVATGRGILALEKIQLQDRKILNIEDFNNAQRLIKLS